MKSAAFDTRTEKLVPCFCLEIKQDFVVETKSCVFYKLLYLMKFEPMHVKKFMHLLFFFLILDYFHDLLGAE